MSREGFFIKRGLECLTLGPGDQQEIGQSRDIRGKKPAERK